MRRMDKPAFMLRKPSMPKSQLSADDNHKLWLHTLIHFPPSIYYSLLQVPLVTTTTKIAVISLPTTIALSTTMSQSKRAEVLEIQGVEDEDIFEIGDVTPPASSRNMRLFLSIHATSTLIDHRRHWETMTLEVLTTTGFSPGIIPFTAARTVNVLLYLKYALNDICLFSALRLPCLRKIMTRNGYIIVLS